MCQNDWKKEPTLSRVSTAGARNSGSAHVNVLRLRHGAQGRKEAREKGSGCALRCGAANERPSRDARSAKGVQNEVAVWEGVVNSWVISKTALKETAMPLIQKGR